MTASRDTIPTASTPSSRRAMLAGVLGGIGAVAASAIARVNPVRAGVDGDVVLGQNNTATTQTSITNNASGGVGFVAYTTSGIALAGTSSSNYGVFGSAATSTGIFGQSSGREGVAGVSNAGTGTLGHSGSLTAPTGKPKTGVYGHAVQDSSSRGVWGETELGQGVRGQATTGTGLYGRAWAKGYALRTRGRFRAEQISGVATIPAGATGVTVTPGVRVSSGAFVLLTPRANIGSRGLWFTTNPSADTFRIRMSATRGADTKVAWLLLG